jgi:hypothetical protein
MRRLNFLCATREVVVSWPGAAAAFAPDDEFGGR